MGLSENVNFIMELLTDIIRPKFRIEAADTTQPVHTNYISIQKLMANG